MSPNWITLKLIATLILMTEFVCMKCTLEILHSGRCFAYELDQKYGNEYGNGMVILVGRCYGACSKYPCNQDFRFLSKLSKTGSTSVNCEICPVQHFEQVASKTHSSRYIIGLSSSVLAYSFKSHVWKIPVLLHKRSDSIFGSLMSNG